MKGGSLLILISTAPRTLLGGLVLGSTTIDRCRAAWALRL